MSSIVVIKCKNSVKIIFLKKNNTLNGNINNKKWRELKEKNTSRGDENNINTNSSWNERAETKKKQKRESKHSDNDGKKHKHL